MAIHAALVRAAVAASVVLQAAAVAHHRPRHANASSHSGCRRSSDIVYVSFERPELYQYVASHHTARALGGKARVHHLNLINTRTDYGRRLQLADDGSLHADLGVQRIDMDLAQVTGYADFWRQYMHSSANGRDYELLCIARFLALRDFCLESGIDVFTHLDGDLMLFDDAVLDAMCIPQNHTAWYLSKGSTFLSTVTCREVGLFADFLLRFYVRANRTQVAVDLHRVGAPGIIDDSHRLEIEWAAPEFVAARVEPRQVSDMFLMRAFYEGDHTAGPTHHPSHPYFLRDEYPRVDSMTALENMRYMFDPDTARRLCEDETVFDANMRLTETEHQYRANGEWHTLLGAHFQGSECKPHLVRSLGRPLLAKGGSVGRDDASP